MQRDKITLILTIMMTFIIVKASSERYHIYNGAGARVAIVPYWMEVVKYLNKVYCTSACTSYTAKPTAAAGTFIVTMF